jgi:alcohol dehydrogenase class IV
MAKDQLALLFKTVVLYGEGRLSGLGNLLQSLNASKVLVVTDRGITKSGIVEKCLNAIKSEHIDFVLFDEVEPNPTTDSVSKGLLLAKREPVNAIVAIGGGSSIDAAKAINVLLANRGKVVDYRGFNQVGKKGLPLIAIPTTAGTGSEMTSFMLISDSETHQKIVCSDPKIIPDLAILDPTLTLSLPPSVTVSTGLDALSHSIESYVSKAANPYSEILSLRATEIIAQNMFNVFKEPSNLDARGQMLMAANMAGLAVHLSYLGAAHSMANPLTSHCNVDHGLAVGMVLPYVMLFNAQSQPKKYRKIAIALGAKHDEGEGDLTISRKGASKLRSLLDELSLPPNLAKMGVREDLIPKMAQEALTQLSLDYNPIKPDLQQMTKLFLSAFRGDLSLEVVG